MWQLSEGLSGFSVHPFMTYHFYCGQEYVRMCTGTQTTEASLVVLAWETFQKATLLQEAPEKKGNQANQVYPGASPPHLSGGTGRDDMRHPHQ